jgi:hypothetical protein
MWTVRHRLATVALTCAIGAVIAPPPTAAADLPAPTGTAPVTGVASTPPWDPAPPTLTGVRYGRHDRYDRTVFDFTGGTPGYRVEYGPLTQQGTGDPVALAGAATLRIVFDGAYPYDVNTGRPTIDLGRVYEPRLPTLRQIRSGGAFEGYVSFGLGLADRVGFRVLRLTSPPRIAVDVAHQPDQPFTTEPVWAGDASAPQVVVTGVRGARHPGYDRFVLDLAGAGTPLISVAYTRYNPSLIHIGLTAGTTRVGTVAAPRVVVFDLPQLRSVRYEIYENGTVSYFVTTDHRTGYRVLLLADPTRIVVDIAY